jgi:3-deoxy-D-manno-octulosonic-acid transferase
MRFWYNLFFTFFFALSTPYYFWKMWRRGNWQEGFQNRFGKYDSRLKQALTNRHVIWIHAVSVGEVNIATHLIRALEVRVPNVKIVVSTTTSTGMGELQKKLPNTIEKIYYPIDRQKFVSRALRTISPEAIILVEAEIWPNFLWSARSRGIPTFLVNARLSEKSFRGYRRFPFLFRRIFASFKGVGVQNEEDARRVKQLGCRPETVHVVGNLKFDAAPLAGKTHLDVAAMLRQLGVPAGAPILVGGSTHAGEEAILARICKSLRTRFPGLFLIAVPRHFERGKEAARDIEKEGMRVCYRSELTPERKYAPGEIDCLLVNTTGELRFFYEVATLIFVGKSLTSEGGQNPIEPGALGKPMVFGPNMQNFQNIVSAFLKAHGAMQVNSAAELEREVSELLSDLPRREQLGKNALMVVRKNQGSIERTVDMVVEHLKNEEIYVRR